MTPDRYRAALSVAPSLAAPLASGADYHTLSNAQRCDLKAAADAVKYRDPRSAHGRSRLYCFYLALARARGAERRESGYVR